MDDVAPRFSVVIPAYNEEALLPACLGSLARQDFGGPVEVIVVDNNSDDATAAIARSMGATVVREPHPGVCWARQRGTSVARGEIVVSTDADTTFEPGWLTRIDAAFRADPRRVAVAGPCRFVQAPWWGAPYTWLLFGLVHVIHLVTGRVLYGSATNIAFRRAASPGYDTSATQGGDELGLLRRLRTRGPIAFDRRNPTNTSSRRLRRGLAYNLLITCLYYYLLGYAVNRLCGRTIVGTAPHVRDVDAPRASASPATARRLALAARAPGWIGVLMAVAWLTTHLIRA